MNTKLKRKIILKNMKLSFIRLSQCTVNPHLITTCYLLVSTVYNLRASLYTSAWPSSWPTLWGSSSGSGGTSRPPCWYRVSWWTLPCSHSFTFVLASTTRWAQSFVSSCSSCYGVLDLWNVLIQISRSISQNEEGKVKKVLQALRTLFVLPILQVRRVFLCPFGFT